MAYPYGTQGAPVAGAGAPGLPSRPNSVGGDPSGAPVQYVVMRANAVYFTPDWATYARVTALGKGGQGLGGLNGPALGATGAHSGGGGGLAATNIEQVSGGTPINITFDSGAARASFLNYQLVGGNGGDATTVAGGAAGVGSGGAINFNGGAGYTVTTTSTAGAGGGGAAGRGGNGSNGGINSATYGGNGGIGDAFTTGGGPGGAGNNVSNGTGSAGLVRLDGSTPGAIMLGKTLQLSVSNASAPNCDGGDGGGGSGGSGTATISNIPGGALVLVELW